MAKGPFTPLKTGFKKKKVLKSMKIHISVVHLPGFISCPETVFSNIFISVTGLNQIFPDIPVGKKNNNNKKQDNISFRG